MKILSANLSSWQVIFVLMLRNLPLVGGWQSYPGQQLSTGKRKEEEENTVQRCP